jgi:hypothetical protein
VRARREVRGAGCFLSNRGRWVLLKGGVWVRCWADRKVGLEVALVVSTERVVSTGRVVRLIARALSQLDTWAR